MMNERKQNKASEPEEVKVDYSEYFKVCNSHLEDTDYHRGISLETLNRFNVGYDPKWINPGSKYKVPEERLIIPTSKHTYSARRIQNAGKDDRFKIIKVGQVVFFNFDAIQNAEEPIFITESEIDALSVIDSGFQAIGLCGCSNADKFLRQIENINIQQPLIIALDNDEAGKNATEKLIKGLTNQDKVFISANVCAPYKDQNERWNNDPESFIIDLTTAQDEAKRKQEEVQAERRAEHESRRADIKTQSLILDIASGATFKRLSTGFKNLDDALDGGIYPGLYVFGAVSSSGKTTFILQLADNLAKSGTDVLYFSLEMSSNELISRCISRETYLRATEPRLAKTSYGIIDAQRWERYDSLEKNLIYDSFNAYREYAQHIYFYEGIGNIGHADIRRATADHIKFYGRKPVVIIDYFQILEPDDPRATDKQSLDKAAVELKRISRDFEIPVITVSALNRQSYDIATDYSSFKGSSVIEYGADVLLGLMPRELKTNTANSKEMMEKWKESTERESQIKVLKNRNGKVGGKAYFIYHTLFNYFEEEKTYTPQKKKMNFI